MFEESEWVVLVEKLQRVTETGAAAWERSGFTYEMKVGGAKYRLGTVDGDGLPPYFLRISDTDLEIELDTLESQPLDEDEWGKKKPASTAAQLLPGLYVAAERAVLGGPVRFKALIEGLDELEPPKLV